MCHLERGNRKLRSLTMLGCLVAGKQGNLRSWLSKSAPASQGCSASQPLQSLQRSESFREAARQPPPGLGKRAAGRAAQKGGSKAAKLQAGPGQSNLRAFMKPQAAQKSAQAASVGSEQNQNPDGSEAGGMSTAAAAAASGPSKEGRVGAATAGGMQAGAGCTAACAAREIGLSEGRAMNGAGEQQRGGLTQTREGQFCYSSCKRRMQTGNYTAVISVT